MCETRVRESVSGCPLNDASQTAKCGFERCREKFGGNSTSKETLHPTLTALTHPSPPHNYCTHTLALPHLLPVLLLLLLPAPPPHRQAVGGPHTASHTHAQTHRHMWQQHRTT